jgi:competence protein ComEA
VKKGQRAGGVLAAVAMAVAAVAYSTAESASAGDAAPVEQLVTERCTRCHDLSVVSARRASAEEWHQIIERMQTNGAQVSDDELETIVQYLAKTYGPDSSSG